MDSDASPERPVNQSSKSCQNGATTAILLRQWPTASGALTDEQFGGLDNEICFWSLRHDWDLRYWTLRAALRMTDATT